MAAAAVFFERIVNFYCVIPHETVWTGGVCMGAAEETFNMGAVGAAAGRGSNSRRLKFVRVFLCDISWRCNQYTISIESKRERIRPVTVAHPVGGIDDRGFVKTQLTKQG